MAKRIQRVIVDGYFVKNFGDDLFLKALTTQIPDTSFELITPPHMINFYKGFGNFTFRKLSLFKKATRVISTRQISKIRNMLFKQKTAYILLGGSIFMEGDWTAGELRHREYESSTSQNFFVIGSNFGPFKSSNYISEYADLLKKANKITFRDNKSKNLFNNFNIDINVLPDVVMAAQLPRSDKKVDSKYALINIMTMSRTGFSKKISENYRKTLYLSIRKYLDEGINIKLLALNEFEGDYDTMYSFYNEYFKNEERVTCNIYDNLDDTLFLFENAEFVLASRYHAMIVSWMYRKPVHVLSYSSKVVDYINTWNDEQNYTNLGSLTEVKEAVSASDYSMISSKILTDLQQLSSYNFTNLKDIFKEN